MATRILSFFRNVLSKPAVEQSLDEELRASVELLTEEKMKEGHSRPAAHRQALMELGGVEQVKEEVRGIRAGRFLEDFARDLRFAIRMLRKSSGITTVAILSLTLAVGINSAVFTFIDRVHLRPVIKERPEEVVSVFTARRGPERSFRPFSYVEYETLRESRELFSDVAAIMQSMSVVGREEALRRSFVFYTTDNYLSLLGTKPSRGRFFTAEETRPGARQPVLVASYPLWQRLGGSEDFLGSTIRVNDTPYTVVGITPRGFTGTTAVLAPEAWLPLGMANTQASPFGAGVGAGSAFDPRQTAFMVLARLRPGLSLEAAQARTEVLDRQLNRLSAGPDRELVLTKPSRAGISFAPMSDSIEAVLGPVALAMAASVLIIASLNLANLLLARGLARRQEFTIRLALGAPRGRIVRQLVLEGLLLGLLGGGLGLALSIWSNGVLLRNLIAQFWSTPFSIALDLAPDARVLAATLGYSTLAVLVFALVPALRSTGIDLAGDLKSQSLTGAGAGRQEHFFSFRNSLVMGQVMLSVMLLSCTALFLRSVLKASQLDLGFVPESRLIGELDYTLGRTTENQVLARQRALLEGISADPGVVRAALSTQVPYGFAVFRQDVRPAAASGEQTVSAISTAVTGGYFDAMGIAMLRGRDFRDVEALHAGGTAVAILDETLARRLFGDRDPLGLRVELPVEKSESGREIVGVIRSPRHQPTGETHPMRIYLPLAQAPDPHVYLHVQLQDAAFLPSFIAAHRRELHAIDPANPLLLTMSMSDFVGHNMALWSLHFAAVLFGILGSLALVLSIVGAYGVKSYLVTRRTREIGLRMALGARPGQVIGLIMRQGVLQTVVAVAVGAVLAVGAGHLLASFLLQVDPADPLALGGASILLGMTVLLACYFPARRASKADPMVALRNE
jgi:predicted permease